MQSCDIMSFRWRLKHLGYTDVSIKKVKWYSYQELYLVKARDPLFGMLLERYMFIEDMYHWR